MADPFTAMAIGGSVAQVGGGLLSAFGADAEGEAGGRMHEYRAGIARKNAQINRQNSDFALEAGEKTAMKSGLTTGFTIGTQKTRQAASGFDVNEGTPEAVRDTTRRIGIDDQLAIRTDFGRKALGFRNAAVMNEQEALMEMEAAKNSRKAGKIKMASTLLGTAGSVASKWGSFSSAFSSGSSNPYYGPLNAPAD